MSERRFFLLLILSWMVFFLIVTPLYAQPRRMVRKTILDYRSELNLNDNQVKKIKKYLAGFEKKSQELRTRLRLLNQEIRSLLGKEAGIKEIENKIRDSFKIKANIVIAEIKAGRHINKTLTSKQVAKWKEIRTKAIKNKLKGRRAK